MATYVKASDDDSLHVEPHPVCDTHSRFDPEGFPLPVGDDQSRRWLPLWGGPCTTCSNPC